MKFIDKTNREIIIKAISIAEKLLKIGSPMMKEIAEKNDWKYDTEKTVKNTYPLGLAVVVQLTMPRNPISVGFYKSKNPFTRAIAYYDGTGIYFNTRKLSNDIADIVATLCHEYGHYCGFSHGDNYKTEDKCKYSVPFYISENTHKWLPDNLPKPAITIIKRKPLWRRILGL